MTAAQRAADGKLLEQQQTRSAHDAAVTNQVVQTAQKQHDAVQQEIRINDTVPNQPVAVPPER
jgi:hypothetical protein